MSSSITKENYYSYNRYLTERFGGKTYKVTVASGLSCPTRDGLLGKGGCAFCDVRGSSSFFGKKNRSGEIRDQIRAKIPAIRERFHASHFLAYFQSYTNTYSDLDYLRSIYEQALDEPEIQGLCIGTRPDCLPDAVIDLLEELAQKSYVSLELGVQSLEDPTLLWLKRGHDTKASLDALERLNRRAPHVHVCVHFMFGSPTDSKTAAKDAALHLNQFTVHGAKLHQLMILERTELGRLYKQAPFPVIDLDRYSEIVQEFIEHLSPKTYLERLCATASHKEECLAPDWSKDRWDPHNKIREHLARNGCVQGSLASSLL